MARVDAQVALELLFAWNRVRCRPPLAGNGVAQFVDSIAGLYQQNSNRTRIPSGESGYFISISLTR